MSRPSTPGRPRPRAFSFALRGGLSLALLGGLALVAPTAEAAEKPVPPSVVPTINWASCGADLEAFQCANVKVPRDYDKPYGAKITLALTRLPAAKPDSKIGTLFTNPGGPGGSGVDFVHQSAQLAYPQSIRDRFDILGFDPRGVARSTPATCYASAAEEAKAVQGLLVFPITPAEEKRYGREQAALAEDCATNSPSRFEHSSTADVARDMDLLRRAVGDPKLSYAGYSYGTFLGATYAKLFPTKIRALALDGTVDPREWSGRKDSTLPIGNRIEQDLGGDQVFEEFLAQCKAAGPDRCALAALGDPATVARQTFDRLKTHPVTITSQGTTVEISYQLAVALTYQSLYSPALWTDAAGLLAQLNRASGTSKALRVSDSVAALVRRGQDYPSLGGSLVSVCADTTSPPRGRYPVVADRRDARFPDFGRFRTWIDYACTYLRQDGIRDEDAYRGSWTQTTRARVLVLGTKFDPATPYKNTRPYAELFSRASIVTLDGWGHTTLGQSRCTDAVVADYLIHPAKRRADVTCATDLKPFTSPGSTTASRASAAEPVRQAAGALG